MAVKQNDWFAINLMNDNVDTLDLMSKGITAENTSMGSRESYKQKQQVQDKFRTESGKFDEDAFNKMYDSCLLTYNSLANNEFEENFLKSVEQHPNYWLEPDAPVLNTNATVSISDDPYHRGMGLSGLTSISDPNWTVREIAQAQEATDENGNGLGWTPNDHALTSGSLKSLWQPTLALAAWDEDGYHEDADGNKIRHRKGEYKLNKNGEFYYEKLGNRSGVGKEILRVSDTVTVDGTWVNKFDLFDADSVDKSVGGTIARTALEIAPMLIPGVNAWLGAAGMVFNTVQAMPEIGKALNSFFGGEKNAWGKSLNRQSNFFKRFASTQSDKGREKFMSFEQVGTQIVDVANQLYQQKFAAQLGGWLSKAVSGNKMPNPKVGRAFSTTYMAATSGMDTYDTAKQAGLNDMWAGIVTLGVMGGFYALMSGDYYKETLFGEDSWLNEEFVTKNTLKNLGKEIELAAKGLPANPTPVQARSVFQKFFEKTKSGISKSWKKLKQGTSKEKVGDAVATAEADTAKAATETASTAAKKLTASEVRAKAQKAVNFGKLGQGEDSGASWFNIMLNRASNEGLEEIMEEAMTDVAKAISVGAEKLGFNVSENETSDIDWGFSFEDFLTRYLTAGIGGFVGGSIFAGIDKWEKIWTPNMRDITSKGISNGERIVYLLQQDGNTKNLISKINKLEKEGAFGDTNLSLRGHAVTDVKGDTTWVFDEASADKSDSQNAQIAKGLRAYVEYIHRTLAAYDFLKNRDDLTGVFLEAREENKAALEKYKEENEFGYKQLEKQLKKENKDRQRAGLPELTIMDMYERYNYSQLAVRAMAKAGLFEDFYHDYAMLGTEIVGLQYNLDAEKSDYLQNHPNDLDGWNNSSTKKRLEERIKEVEKQRDAILSGERNAEFVDRAIYEAWTPVSDQMLKMGDKNATPLAERSLFDYAMNRYGIDINESDMTKGEKELLQSDFDAYKALEKKDKVRASFDVFYNISKLLQPEFEEYYTKRTTKAINPYFKTSVDAANVQRQVADIQRKLQEVDQQMKELGMRPNSEVVQSWDPAVQKFAKLFDSFGVAYDDVVWEDSSWKAEGAWDPKTNKFHIKKGTDEKQITNTIIHEVVGHYGLRQILNSPSVKKNIEKLTGKTDLETEDAMAAMMDYFWEIATSSVKDAMLKENVAKTYGFSGISNPTVFRNTFNKVIEEWATPPEEDKMDATYKNVRATVERMFGETDWSTKTDDEKTDAYNKVETFGKRYLVEEYLADLAGRSFAKDSLDETTKELNKEEKNWFRKVINFIAKIFRIEGGTQKEDFFKELMMASAQNLKKNRVDAHAKNVLNEQFNKDSWNGGVFSNYRDIKRYNSEERQALILEHLAKFDIDSIQTKVADAWRDASASVKEKTFGVNPDLDRSYVQINSFKALTDMLLFNGQAIDTPTTIGDNLSGKKIDSMFMAIGYKGFSIKSGIRAIAYNDGIPGIKNRLAELKNIIRSIDPNIQVVSYSELNSGQLKTDEDNLLAGTSWTPETLSNYIEDLGDELGWDAATKALFYAKINFGEYDVIDNQVVSKIRTNLVYTNESGEQVPLELFNVEGYNPTTDINPKSPIIWVADTPNKFRTAQAAKGNLINIGKITIGKKSKNLYVTPAVFDQIKEADYNYDELPAKKALNDTRAKLEAELDHLNLISVNTKYELSDIKEAKELKIALDSRLQNISNPTDPDISRNINEFLEILKAYTDYCTNHNVDDINANFVVDYLNTLKATIKDRIKFEAFQRINTSKVGPEQTLDEVLDEEYMLESFDTLLNNYLDAKFNGETQLAKDNYDALTNAFNVGDILKVVLNDAAFNDNWIQEITDALVPELQEFSKILEKLQVNRLGETISLYKYIKLGLKGSEPESQMKLQDYAMEASDASELLDVLDNANTLVNIIANGAARINDFAMFDFWNIYDKGDENFFVFNNGERTLATFKDDYARLSSKLNFLKSLTEKNSERQIKVQKIVAKKMNLKLMEAILKGGKLFNVDIPELWKEVNEELPTVTEDMTDEEFAKFFEQIKKFEKALYEKLQEDGGFKTASDEDIVNAIKDYLKFDSNEQLSPGTIEENNVELTGTSIASYLYSIVKTNSDDFYSKLGKVLTDNSDIKIPFPTQLFCIRIGYAYINDSENGFNLLCEKFGVNPEVFLKNVYGVFGSAGTGKTTVIANILGKLNSDKNIYFGAAAQAQLDKLKSAVNTDTEHLVQVNDLVENLDPDWKSHAKYNEDTGYYTYTGTIKSTSYDDKLKDGVLVIDESTKFNSIKWNILSKWAEQNNVKIIALGDLKQSGESFRLGRDKGVAIFTDLSLLRAPILTESIRPGNQAQRSNLNVFGKILDSAVENLIKTRDVNDTIEKLKDSSFTLKYKDVTGRIIGTKIIDSESDFRSKIAEVNNNLKDGEKIAIITSDHTYDNLASEKIEIVSPEDAQGNEWEYVFVDTTFDLNKFEGLQLLYTVMSRAKFGSLILGDDLEVLMEAKLNATFAEDKEGDLPIAANPAQFKVYNDWMSNLLKGTKTPTSSSESSSEESPSTSETGSTPIPDGSRHRFLAEASKYYNVPDFYIDNLDDEFLIEVCKNIATTNVGDFGGNRKVGNYKGAKFARIKISDNVFIPFFRTQIGGTFTWQPADIDAVGNVSVDVHLAKSNFVKKLGTILDQTLKSEIRNAKDVSYDDIFRNKITPENTEDAIDELIMDIAISNFSDLTADINAVKDAYDNPAEVSTYLQKAQRKLENAKATRNNIDDNFYVKRLNKKLYGNTNFTDKFLNVDEEKKTKAVKVIADLIKVDAVRVSAQITKKVKEITPRRFAHIQNILHDALPTNIADQILDTIFNNDHIFYIKDTNVANMKEMYLQVGDMQIFIGIVRNSTYTQGTYRQGGLFGVLFRRTAISARGTRRTSVEDLKNDGMFQFAPPAIIVADDTVNQRYQDIIQNQQRDPDNYAIQNFINWMVRNNGKVMQAYTNISYLDLTDIQDVYTVTQDLITYVGHDGQKHQGNSYWGYNDTYGSIMGVQKSVKLSQLYVLSILAHYAQTGNPEFLQLVQQVFPNIETQHDALTTLSNILGSTAGMEEISSNDLPATRRKKINENKKKFATSGLMINPKQNEKIQTAAILAMIDPDFADKNINLGNFLFGFTKDANEVNFNKNALGLRFTIYNNNKFKSGENGANIKGEYKVVKRSINEWALYKKNSSGWKLITTKESQLLDTQNFRALVSQICFDLGESSKTIDEFLRDGVSIQIIKNYRKNEQWKDFNLNIVDFFVNLLNNDAFGDPAALFAKMEEYFNSLGNGLFRSGIYLETRSDGANYITNNATPQDSFWKEVTADGTEIPFSTDIIKIFNPIRSVELTPVAIGTTSSYTSTDFVNDFAGKELLGNSEVQRAMQEVKGAKTKEEFLAKLNENLKTNAEEDLEKLVYENYDEDGNLTLKYDVEKINRIFGPSAIVEHLTSYKIAINDNGTIKIYNPYDFKEDVPIKEFSAEVIDNLNTYAESQGDEIKNEVKELIQKLYEDNISDRYDIYSDFEELEEIWADEDLGIVDDQTLHDIYKKWYNCS